MADAASRGDLDRMRGLLAEGVKVNSIIDGRYGWTCIMHAAFHGRTEAVALLIEHGADVNHIDNEGNSAITLAGSKNHWECAEALAEAGADVTHENLKEKSALTYARHAKQKAFLKKWQSQEVESE